MAKKRKDTTTHDEVKHRVPVVVPLWMSDYLDELGSEAKRTGGFKLAKTTFIRAMIQAMRTVDEKSPIDLSGVTTEDELTVRLLNAYKKYRK